MDELISQIRSILIKCWEYRRFALLTAYAICAVGWTAVALLPDSYRAETRVYIDTSTMLGRSLKGLAVESEDQEGEFLNQARALLLSEPNLEQVILDNDLDIEISSPLEKRQVLDSLLNVQVDSDSTGDSFRSPKNIISIQYDSVDPQLAFGVVTSLLDIFLESMTGTSRQNVESTERFIEDKLAEYRARLEASELTLRDFKRLNVGLLPESGTDYYSEMQDLRTKLREVDFDLSQKVGQRDELRNQIEQISRGELSAGTAATAERISEIESRLIDLLLKYTENHPDVIALERTLKQLKDGVSASSAGRNILDSAALSGNPVLEELRVQLGILDATVAADGARKGSYEIRFNELEDAINVIPEIEAQLAKLTRDYDINKGQYDELLTRLEATRLSRDRDVSEGDVIYRVIEPPQLPLVPEGPKRLQLSMLVFLAALAGACGVAFVFTQIRPTFVDVSELSKTLSIDIIGSIAQSQTSESTLTSYYIYAAALAALLVSYVIYLYLVVFI